MYFSGEKIEFLTPGSAAKLNIISNLFNLKKVDIFLSFEISTFLKKKFLFVLKRMSLFFLKKDG
jgi:hypothetical protein